MHDHMAEYEGCISMARELTCLIEQLILIYIPDDQKLFLKHHSKPLQKQGFFPYKPVWLCHRDRMRHPFLLMGK